MHQHFLLLLAFLLLSPNSHCETVCIPGRDDPGCYSVEEVSGVEPPEHSVTLITQLTLSKVKVLTQALGVWEGYSSLVFYAYDSKEALAVREFQCDKCIVTLVQGGTRKQPFPINLLRQVALDAARTELVFTLDTDFVPSAGLYEVIKQHLSTPLVGKALVVPAFEFRVNYTAGQPKYSDLKALLNGRELSVFHSKFGGHKDTKTDLWLRSDKSYCLNRTSGAYEPYVIVNTSNPGFPSYDVNYVNRGMNKIIWIRALKRAKFQFCVLPRVFLIHAWERRPHRLPGRKKKTAPPANISTLGNGVFPGLHAQR